MATEGFPVYDELVIDQGADFRRFYAMQREDGTWFDTTDYTARMQVRDSVESDTVVIELTTENARITTGMTIGDYETGVLLALSATETSALEAGFVGGYDLEIVSPSGNVDKLARGRFCVEGEYTR